MQKARNDLRAFRWGACTHHPNAPYLHPAVTFANRAVSQEEASRVMNPTPKAMIAVLSHVHTRKPAPGRMPNAACGTQVLPGRDFSTRKENWHVLCAKNLRCSVILFGQMEIISLTHRGKIDISIAHVWRIEKTTFDTLSKNRIISFGNVVRFSTMIHS